VNFSPDTLYIQLLSVPQPAAWQVAFSGGLDSSALLHAMAALRDRFAIAVGAVHVHHGLQADADAWVNHCRRVCTGYDIPLSVLHADARPAQGESPEAAARLARYAVLADWLVPDHCLLTAQHQDDQAETLLLQLLRGAGVHGLAAMPVCTALGAGTHLRPLLSVRRQALLEYARADGLEWIEDPSNAETGLDRNFLRHDVMPLLRSRWPALAGTLSRSAAHAAEAAGLLDALAADDRQAVAGPQADTLSVSALHALSPARQRNLLRGWMKQQGGHAPPAAVLARVQHDMLASRPDAMPCVQWGGHAVRRYRDALFVLPERASDQPRPEPAWRLDRPLSLAHGGMLTATPTVGEGLRQAAIAGEGVHIRWRRGGETCRPSGRGHRHALKKLFQEAGVPPWQRDRIPLLYVEDKLAAVAGLWICEPFQAGPREAGFRIDWVDEGLHDGCGPD
jgi:tRNA(Ile)-lysidine synthase